MAEGQDVPVNAELVHAIETVVAQDSPENRNAVYQALLQSKLLIPVAHPLGEDGKPGLQEVVGSTPIEFVVMQDKQNTMSLLAFTDEESVKAWKPEGACYIAPFATDLFQMALEMNAASIVVNVAGPKTRGQIMRQEFQPLANGLIPTDENRGGTTPVEAPPDRPVSFGVPTIEPTDQFMDALRHALADHPEVTAGYLLEGMIEEGKSHLVAAFRFDQVPEPDPLKMLMDDIGNKVSEFLAQDEFVDFVVLGPNDPLPVENEEEVLVYRRE